MNFQQAIARLNSNGLEPLKSDEFCIIANSIVVNVYNANFQTVLPPQSWYSYFFIPAQTPKLVCDCATGPRMCERASFWLDDKNHGWVLIMALQRIA